MRILVTGHTGAIGSELAPRLLADGHDVRVTSRRSEVAVPGGAEFVSTDVLSGRGLDRALAGIDVAYYLIHSMEPEAGTGFALHERVSAANFADAARRAGVRRTVYLGGLIPADAPPSAHLASRLAVENLLLAGTPEAIAFRASIVIGARSRSFRFLVRLVERLPVLLIPAWRHHVTAPIDMRDVTEFLVRAALTPEVGQESVDIAGPDVVGYGELIERIRDAMLLARPVLNIPRLTVTPIASRVSSVIAGEEHALIGPLMGGLTSDLLPRDDTAATRFGVRRHSLERAIERALGDWEAVEELKAR
jgi:uncharacterized protein YbjT (DUF2867 family)